MSKSSLRERNKAITQTSHTQTRSSAACSKPQHLKNIRQQPGLEENAGSWRAGGHRIDV